MVKYIKQATEIYVQGWVRHQNISQHHYQLASSPESFAILNDNVYPLSQKKASFLVTRCIHETLDEVFIENTNVWTP